MKIIFLIFISKEQIEQLKENHQMIKKKSEIKKQKTKKLGYINEKYIKILEENKTLKEKLNIKE